MVGNAAGPGHKLLRSVSPRAAPLSKGVFVRALFLLGCNSSLCSVAAFSAETFDGGYGCAPLLTTGDTGRAQVGQKLDIKCLSKFHSR